MQCYWLYSAYSLRNVPSFICPKATVETPEQCVKSVQVNNKDIRRRQ